SARGMQILQASNPRLHVKVLALRHSIPGDARPPGAREVLACQRSAKQRHGRGATLSARQKFLGKQTKSLLRRERRMCANYGLVRRSPHSMTVSARVRSHITSWPTDGATDSIGANWPIPHAGAGSRRTPLALRRERSVEQLQ